MASSKSVIPFLRSGYLLRNSDSSRLQLYFLLFNDSYDLAWTNSCQTICSCRLRSANLMYLQSPVVAERGSLVLFNFPGTTPHITSTLVSDSTMAQAAAETLFDLLIGNLAPPPAFPSGL